MKTSKNLECMSNELNSVHAQLNSCLSKCKNVRKSGRAEVHVRRCDAIKWTKLQSAFLQHVVMLLRRSMSCYGVGCEVGYAATPFHLHRLRTDV